MEGKQFIATIRKYIEYSDFFILILETQLLDLSIILDRFHRSCLKNRTHRKK